MHGFSSSDAFMPDTDAPRSRLWRDWMVDTVRLAEEPSHPYDDGAIVRALVPGTAKQRVAARNLALAHRLGLPAAGQRWLRGLRMGGWVLALLAVISGVLAARATVGGDSPVNLFWALTGLLGLQGVTLVLWVVSLMPGVRLGSVPLRLMLRAGQWWEGRGNTLPGGEPAATLLPRAALGMVQRARLLPALGGLASHVWWWLAMSATLLTLLALFATERYAFTWATTLLSPDVFLRFTQGLGTLPAALGFPLPDANLVARTVAGHTLTAGEQALWSQWLLGCLVVYGWLPRLLAGLACVAWLWVRRGAIEPDWSATDMAVQCARLGDTRAAPQVIDPDPGDSAPARVVSATPMSENDTHRRTMAVGLELADDIPWPPPDLDETVGNAGNIIDRAQRNAVLARLRELAPEAVWIAVDGRQTPDRGTLATLRELAERAATARVRIYVDAQPGHASVAGERREKSRHDRQTAETARVAAWRRRLNELGLGAVITVVTLGTAPPARAHPADAAASPARGEP